MTEHLPECHQPKYLKDLSWGSISRDEPFVPCICDELRSNALFFKLGRAAGIKDGLGAARDAVAALDHAPRCELVWGCECSESHPLECTCNRDDALAAIDALKEEQ